MRDRWLWTTLIVPLGLASAVLLFVLHRILPLDGFWLNLSASFIAIVVTILYVDRILERHDQRKWDRSSTLITRRAMLTSTGNITNIRSALGVPPMETLSTQPDAVNADYLTYCATAVEPAVRSSVSLLDVEGWKGLAKAIQASYTNAENLLSLFGPKLDPRELELLIELQNLLRSSVQPYETFPDLLGVPDKKLPKTKSDSRLLRDHHVEWAGRELEAAVRTCRQLGEYELGKLPSAP